MRETVVPPNRAFGVFVLLFLLGAAGGLGLASISVSEADEWSDYLDHATSLTMLAWALLLVASTRVDGIGDQLKIVNFLVTITVPADRVRGAEAENGLAVVLDDETRIECVAYGSSVLQDLIPRLRPARHVPGLVEWVSHHGGGQSVPTSSDREVRTSIRTYVWCAPPALWLGSAAFMAVVRSAADPLRALFQVPM